MPDRLRPLWDFDDLDATERRFRSRLDEERSDAGRAEVLTQIARAHGLRDDFERCATILDEAETLAGESATARIRIELERGRMHRSSDDSDAALPFFESAFQRAVEANEHYLAGDAAHMCAITVSDRELMRKWTELGLELAEREPEAAYWAGPLLNNLGWAYFDVGQYDQALELFEQALEARERDLDNESGVAWARYALAQTLRLLDRNDEALRMLRPALEWSERSGKLEPAFADELAEISAARAASGRPE